MSYADLLTEEAIEVDRFENTDPWVRLWGKKMDFMGTVGDYVSVKFTEKWNAVGAGTLILEPDDPLALEVLALDPHEVVRITLDIPGYRWSGSLLTAKESVSESGAQVVELDFLHDWQFLESMLIWNNPLFPAFLQPTKSSRRIGPICTVIASQIVPNLIRLQAPLWQLPTNGSLIDFNTWNLIKNATQPVCVKPINPLTDTSRWVTSSATFCTASQMISEALAGESGVIVRIHQWLPGDPQPWKNAGFTEPRLWIDIIDKGNEQAFTGTVIDGVIKTVAEMVDGGLSWLVYPILGSTDKDFSLQESLGINQKKAIAFYPHPLIEDTGIKTSESTHHRPLASQVVVGGKSPEWLNKTIEIGFSSAFGALGAAVGAATGGAFAPALAPVGELLSTLAKDKLFAYAAHEDYVRARKSGPWRWREVAKLGGTGLSPETWQNIISGLYATRAYSSHKIAVYNGEPYYWGRDLDLGEFVGYETIGGQAEVDRISEVTFSDDRGKRNLLEFSIGDGSDEEEPGTKAMRKFKSVVGWINDFATST